MLKKVKYNLRKNETYYIYDCKNSNFEEKALKNSLILLKGSRGITLEKLIDKL